MHAGFCHFTRVRVNKHIPPFTGEGLSLFPFTGLYMLRFRLIGECQPVSPTAGEQRFNSVTQHNVLFMLCILEPPIAIPGSRCDVWTWHRKEQRLTIKPGLSQIAAVRQLHAERRRHWCKSEICDQTPQPTRWLSVKLNVRAAATFPGGNSVAGSANSFPVASNRSVLNSLFPEIQRKERSC